MTLFPTCEFPLLGDSDAIGAIRAAVSAGNPFSMIRVNDGEAVALAFSEDMTLQDLAYLHGHWGAAGVTLSDVATVRRDLEEAMDGADVVGIRNDIVGVDLPEDLLNRRGPEIHETVVSAFDLRTGEVDNLSVIGARRLVLLHRVLSRHDWPDSQLYCSVWIHWELLASGALASILSDVDEVGLVTSRPELENLVTQRFGVRTSVVTVPDKFVDAQMSGAHVPRRYGTIRPELDFPKGTLVLVGAGIPGKVYCQWLKEAGCIAIDVGSVFDAWVGKASRPRILESRFGIAGGSTVPDSLQLRETVSGSHRVLTPRWRPSGELA